MAELTLGEQVVTAASTSRLAVLRLKDIGVIAAADVEFGPGLTAITGETGAGKTMILTGLGMVLGERVSAERVRHGAQMAHAEAEWLGAPPLARDLVIEAGGSLEEDAILAARLLPAAGRARATLGGKTVPAATLSQLAEQLIAVHGQAEQNRLRNAGRQRYALDAFAQISKEKAAHLENWREYLNALQDLDTLEQYYSQAEQTRTDLLANLAEIGSIAPEDNEDQKIAAEITKLAAVEQLRSATQNAHGVITGGDWDTPSLTGGINQARTALAEASEIDPALQPLIMQLQDVGYQLEDVAVELAAYIAGLEYDPRRLEWLQQRRWELNGLMRRFGPTLADVTAYAASAQTQLDRLDPQAVAAGRERVACATTQLAASAKVLHEARIHAADRLANAVTAELAALAMPYATVQVEVSAAEMGPHGSDTIHFRLAPHTGATPIDIAEGASGGELSRIMLALELSLSADDAPGTFVFDEIDAGVGGAAAVELGRRLARLAQRHQVIVVTHLPQVAAFADSHIVVTKQAATDAVTAADVRQLKQAQRIEELARMLAGTVTASARAHAEELLKRYGVRT